MSLDGTVEVDRRLGVVWIDTGKLARPLDRDEGDADGRLTLFTPDEEIAVPHRGAPNLFEVLFGVTRISTVLSDGRRTVIAFHFPGEIFGFELGGNRGFHAEAVDAVGIRAVSVPAGERDDSCLLRLALTSLAVAQEHLLVVGRQTANERVASFLLDIDRRQRHPAVLDLPMPRIDIADYLGLTAETVCRVFKVLQERGLVDFITPRRVIIKSAEGLDRLAA